MRQVESFTRPLLCLHSVPARNSFFTVFDVLFAQQFVQRIAQRYFARIQLTILNNSHREVFICREVIGVLLAFLVATLQSCREEVSGVGADLAAKKIERVTEQEVD